MSTSKSSSDFPSDPPDSLPPPSYTSIYDPAPPSSDTKTPRLTSLTDLRTRISQNRTSASDPAAVLQRRLVAQMADRTSLFLSTYGTTIYTRARLSFCADTYVTPSSTEVLTGTAAEDALEEYAEFEVLPESHFWADREAAKGLADGLERVLEERLGVKKMRDEGVDLQVKEEEGSWRRENVFGVWETGTGWGVVVRIKVDVVA